MSNKNVNLPLLCRLYQKHTERGNSVFDMLLMLYYGVNPISSSMRYQRN